MLVRYLDVDKSRTFGVAAAVVAADDGMVVTVIVVVELMGMPEVVLRLLQWWRVVAVVGWCLFPCGGDWWWSLRVFLVF